MLLKHHNQRFKHVLKMMVEPPAPANSPPNEGSFNASIKNKTKKRAALLNEQQRQPSQQKATNGRAESPSDVPNCHAGLGAAF